MKELRLLLRLNLRRMVSRASFKFAITLVSVLITISFIAVCCSYYGHDLGNVPSAAYGWVGNMDLMQSTIMHILIYFLLFLVGSSAFSDNLLIDKKSLVINAIFSRCSIKKYILANYLVSFIAAFLVVFIPLLISQALSYIVFPVNGTVQGYSGTPAYSVGFSADHILFPGLYFQNLLLYNVFFMVYCSTWAGIMAMFSFAISLFFQKSRLAAIGIPTILVFLSSMIIPMKDMIWYYLYPLPGMAGRSEAIFFFAPLAVFLVTLGLVLLSAKRKDLMTV